MFDVCNSLGEKKLIAESGLFFTAVSSSFFYVTDRT